MEITSWHRIWWTNKCHHIIFVSPQEGWRETFCFNYRHLLWFQQDITYWLPRAQHTYMFRMSSKSNRRSCVTALWSKRNFIKYRTRCWKLGLREKVAIGLQSGYSGRRVGAIITTATKYTLKWGTDDDHMCNRSTLCTQKTFWSKTPQWDLTPWLLVLNIVYSFTYSGNLYAICWRS